MAWKTTLALVCTVLVVIIMCSALGTYLHFKRVCYTRHNHTMTALDDYMPNVFHNREQQVQLLHMLRRSTKALSKYNITHWMIAGNLLGFERHGGLIPWDDDIDIAVPVAELGDLFEKKKDLERNFRLTVTNEERHGIYKIYSLHHDGTIDRSTFIDVFTFSKNDNGVYCPEDPQFPTQCLKETDIFPLRVVDMQGVNVFVPRDSTDHLNRTYGKKWNDELFVRPPHSNSVGPFSCAGIGYLIRHLNKSTVVYPNNHEISSAVRSVVLGVAEDFKKSQDSK